MRGLKFVKKIQILISKSNCSKMNILTQQENLNSFKTSKPTKTKLLKTNWKFITKTNPKISIHNKSLFYK